jgi:glycosyltransferase involved in cell wall biosynthesis
MKVLLFIPVYNCENQIIRVINQITPEIGKLFDTVLVINNVSVDGTEKAAMKELMKLPFINRIVARNHVNYGYGGSVKLGIKFALENGFDYLLLVHGDDQACISDFAGLLSENTLNRHKTILGARFMSGSTRFNYSRARVLGNIGLNFCYSIVLRRWIPEMGSGLNLYPTKIFLDGFYWRLPDDLTIQNCLLLFQSFYGHEIEFAPISWCEEDQVSNARLFRQALKILKMLVTYMVGPKKFTETSWTTQSDNEYGFEIVYEGVREAATIGT